MDLKMLNLNQIDEMYCRGHLSEGETISYIRNWNQGPHYIQAVLWDGKIRTFDSRISGVCYRHLKEKFNLHL